MKIKILKIYGCIFAIGMVYYLLRKLTQFSIPCIFYRTTGLECPGCGVTRMFDAMIKLDFVSAFFYNPVVFLLFLLWNLIGLFCFWGKIAWIKSSRFFYMALGITVGILMIWGIVRNVS